MKAVIMAGGEGTRLRPALPGIAKPMALLGGRPVLERIIYLLKHSGITDLHITLRYKPESIIDYFGDGKGFGVDIKYHIENEPLGTAGGVRACFGEGFSRDILVISGDAACDFDLKELIECHHRHKAPVTMALYSSSDPLAYGLVLTDPRGKVRSFIEKPPWEKVVTNYVNTGIYILSPEALNMIPKDKAYDFAKDLFPKIMEEGLEIRGLALEGYWCDIGNPKAYYQCNLDALEGRLTLYNEYGNADLDFNPKPSLQTIPARTIVYKESQSFPCTDRARLMRALSESLMEAGADFTDGLSLKSEKGEVRISPHPEKSALIIEADKKELCSEFQKLASSFADFV
ncbi:nucleotidyltransferase family protein [Clostridiaceae bacterium OttesenSCG-928-D20]|nr:nucleotidyltransferase family protein [Clostridiaceae bacterium OttesenSCG-928-D20]